MDDDARSLLLLLRNLLGRPLLVYSHGTALPVLTHHGSGTNGDHNHTQSGHQKYWPDRKQENYNKLEDSGHFHDTDCHDEDRITNGRPRVTVEVI